MAQIIRTVRTAKPSCNAIILSFSVIILAGCVPTHVRELEWCRNIEATQSLVDEKGRDKLAKAMTDNKCAAKFLAAQKAAEKKAKEAAKLSAAKQQAKKPNRPVNTKPSSAKAKP